MSKSVRKQKSGDQLAVGDWLAPGEISDLAAEVLYTVSYLGVGGVHVRLVARQLEATVPFTDVVAGNHLLDLASDEDLAEYRKAAERAAIIADIRAFAVWLEQNPWAPAPRHLRASEQFGNSYNALGEVAGIAKVREVADRLGVKVDEELDDRTRMEVEIGRVEYSVLSWHKGGRPAEPELDATGLNYGRGDEAQDPQPTAGRVPPHLEDGRTGEAVGEPPMHYLLSGQLVCGVELTDDAHFSMLRTQVTCSGCRAATEPKVSV